MSPRICCGRHWENFTRLFEHRMKSLICPLHGQVSNRAYEKMEKIRQKTLQAMHKKKLQDEQKLKIELFLAKSSNKSAMKATKSPVHALNIPAPSVNKPVRGPPKDRTAVAANLANHKRISPLKLVKRSDGNATILKKDPNDRSYRPSRAVRASQQTNDSHDRPRALILNPPEKSVLTRHETRLSIQMTTATTHNQSTNNSSDLPKSPETNSNDHRHRCQSSDSGTEITNAKSAAQPSTPAPARRHSRCTPNRHRQSAKKRSAKQPKSAPPVSTSRGRGRPKNRGRKTMIPLIDIPNSPVQAPTNEQRPLMVQGAPPSLCPEIVMVESGMHTQTAVPPQLAPAPAPSHFIYNQPMPVPPPNVGLRPNMKYFGIAQPVPSDDDDDEIKVIHVSKQILTIDLTD